jgi:hypothetical protein
MRPDPGLTIARDMAARRQRMVEMLQARGMTGRQLARALGYSLAEAQRYGLVARDYARQEPVKEVPATGWAGPEEQVAWQQAQLAASFLGLEPAGLVWTCLNAVVEVLDVPLTAVVGRRQETPDLLRARRLWWLLVFQYMPTLSASRLAPICGFDAATIRQTTRPDAAGEGEAELLPRLRRAVQARKEDRHVSR